MVHHNGFNGKCLIEFTYRRENGAWRLIENKIDSRIEGKLGKEFFRELDKSLSEIPNAYRPYKHEGLLLEALGRLKLDQSIAQDLGDPSLGDGQQYSIQIIVNQRHEKKAHGLAEL